jgi:hypothetical protein
LEIRPDVRFGSLADMTAPNIDVRLPPEADMTIYAALQCLCSIDVPRPSAQLLGLVTSLDERQRDFVAIGTTVKQVGTLPKYECALLSLFSYRICHFR